MSDGQRTTIASPRGRVRLVAAQWSEQIYEQEPNFLLVRDLPAPFAHIRFGFARMIVEGDWFVCLTIAGTNDLRDLRTSLDGRGYLPCQRLHRKYHKVALAMRPHVDAYILQDPTRMRTPAVITGHSMGGGIAIALAQYYPDAEVISFGAPNVARRNWWKKHGKNLEAVEAEGDPIPRMITGFGSPPMGNILSLPEPDDDRGAAGFWGRRYAPHQISHYREQAELIAQAGD